MTAVTTVENGVSDDSPPDEGDKKPRVQWFRNISMATWLALAMLAVMIFALGVTSIVSLTYGTGLANDLVDDLFDSRLALKADRVGRYTDDLRDRTLAIAAAPGTIDALESLTSGFAEVEPPDETMEEEVTAWYRDDFVPTLNERGASVTWGSLLPVSDAGIVLQDLYVVSPPDAESARILDDAGDGSEWSAVHAAVHPGLLDIAERTHADDLMLIDGSTGDVVYTVSKRPDFATNLDTGPYSGTALAAVARAVADNPVEGQAAFVDLSPYMPATMSPTGFVIAPIFGDDGFSGLVATAFSTEQLDEIMTSDTGGEPDAAAGGGLFLVGPDGRMRSVARAFLDDEAGYLSAVTEAGSASAAEVMSMEEIGTTVTFQQVTDTGSLADVADASGDPTVVINHLGIEVLDETRPAGIDGLDWFVTTQVPLDIVHEPIDRFRNFVGMAVAVFVVVVTFLSVGWASGLFQPVRGVSERLRRLHDGEPDIDVPVADRAPRDFTELAGHIDRMIHALRRRHEDVERAAEARRDTLRALLPMSISRRVEAGDRRVLDHIAQATVAVLVIDGLGDLVRSSDLEDSRTLLDELVEQLDQLAVSQGLERIKLIGDAYYAGCGITHPYLDHAPRTVAFAEEVRELVDEVTGGRLRVTAGVSSGSVNVGLAGSSRLIYDVWGEPVTVAHSVARAGSPGEILVTDATREMLPPDTVATRRNADDGFGMWAVGGPGEEEGS